MYGHKTDRKCASKHFLVMRLTVIFVCLFVLGGRASVLSQYRVNVKLGETTYKHLFEEIRKQTGCIVMYSDDMLDKNAKVKATFENVTLDNVLREILADKGLTFEKMQSLSPFLKPLLLSRTV